LASPVPVRAEDAVADAPHGDAVKAEPDHAKKKSHASAQDKSTADAKPASASALEARHKDCLAFIERHGLSCDPWVTPTCGYDIGYARPLTCVAP
jgi:hypothetical protein